MIGYSHALLVLSLISGAGTMPLSAASTGADQRRIPPATVVMRFPEALGGSQRPAVEFDHSAHTAALQKEGCEACHAIDERGLVPKLTGTLDLIERDSLIDAFHSVCTQCHETRADAGVAGGPLTCGECHVRRPPGVSLRVALAFDYSLHARHAAAFPEKCDPCHHIYDEAEQKLTYQKGTEEACRSCHGAVDVERTLSLANASHSDCVGCHLQRSRAQQEGGPVLCVGCHDRESVQGIERLEEVPRLLRGQPDRVWITAADARSKLVAFDHQAHEPRTGSCSACHHRTLKACKECHTLTGTEEGAGVTMAQAYHLPSSEESCVGCHATLGRVSACSGCHRSLAQQPGERACTVCHSGPQPAAEPPVEAAPPVAAQVALDALPALSDEFPETVVIESLAEKYEPSRLPHAKIVGKLDSGVRESPLAGRFHGRTVVLCAGCHHHSPAGTRPPPCRGCHGDTADATTDKPGLRVAYHRQCLGCHRAMGIPKQGCIDCHAVKEVQS